MSTLFQMTRPFVFPRRFQKIQQGQEARAVGSNGTDADPGFVAAKGQGEASSGDYVLGGPCGRSLRVPLQFEADSLRRLITVRRGGSDRAIADDEDLPGSGTGGFVPILRRAGDVSTAEPGAGPAEWEPLRFLPQHEFVWVNGTGFGVSNLRCDTTR